jgi:hypothetical protein
MGGYGDGDIARGSAHRTAIETYTQVRAKPISPQNGMRCPVTSKTVSM